MVYPLTSEAIEATVQKLASDFPLLCTSTVFDKPTQPIDGSPRQYSFLKIGKGISPDRPAALIVAGLHARELAPPDAVLNFFGKLLQAYTAGKPCILPAFEDISGTGYDFLTIPNFTVKAIIECMDTYIVPLANPDGRAFVLGQLAKGERDPQNLLWRKNRSIDLPTTPPDAVGTDLNRNFDIAWDFDRYYSPAVAQSKNFLRGTSKNPESIVYRGPFAFSEAETQNIKSMLDKFPISFYIDLHTWGPNILYPWSIEDSQSFASFMNFLNPQYDGQRDGSGPTRDSYSEYFPNKPPIRLLDRHESIANFMAEAIKSATGERYDTGHGVDLYTTVTTEGIDVTPTTGGSDDYAFSRQFDPFNPSVMHAFTLEAGNEITSFVPNPDYHYPRVEREIHAALTGWVSYIAIWHGLFP